MGGHVDATGPRLFLDVPGTAHGRCAGFGRGARCATLVLTLLSTATLAMHGALSVSRPPHETRPTRKSNETTTGPPRRPETGIDPLRPVQAGGGLGLRNRLLSLENLVLTRVLRHSGPEAEGYCDIRHGPEPTEPLCRRCPRCRLQHMAPIQLTGSLRRATVYCRVLHPELGHREVSRPEQRRSP